MQEKVFVRETFKGIDRVFPGKKIIKTRKINDSEFGVLTCMNCGHQGSVNVYGLWLPMRLTFNGEFMNIELDKNKAPITNNKVALFGYDEYYVDDDIILLEEYVDVNNDVIRCPHCGYSMGFDYYAHTNECPGCNICGGEARTEDTISFCVKMILDGNCKSKKDDDCLNCAGHYARIKNNVTLESLWKKIKMVMET